MSTILADRFSLGAGDYLDHRYQVKRELGEGTYGIVYLVEDNDNKGYHLAAKVLKLYDQVPNQRAEIHQRFQREFDCGQIKSPYLVSAIDKGEVRGNPFFLMEYCQNGSAANWVNKNVDFYRIDRFAKHVLLGLHELHKAGIIHRDLKPENVLLGDNNVAKLTDFGIAGYQNSRLTKVNILGYTKGVFGTYAYIAPEQANSATAYKTLGPTADMFSFGVMMYEIICGRYPFGTLESEAHVADYLRRASKGMWDSIISHRGDVPDRWVYLLERCLSFDHRTRIQSAHEALQVLGEISTPATTIAPFDFYNDLFGLQVMHGEEPGRIYNLSREVSDTNGTITIGWYDARNAISNQITIKESQTAYISRHHATIEKNGPMKCWIIKDGQWRNKDGQYAWYPSTNGTLVNSKEADQYGVVITPGDIITIGDTTLKVVTRKR